MIQHVGKALSKPMKRAEWWILAGIVLWAWPWSARAETPEERWLRCGMEVADLLAERSALSWFGDFARGEITPFPGKGRRPPCPLFHQRPENSKSPVRDEIIRISGGNLRDLARLVQGRGAKSRRKPASPACAELWRAGWRRTWKALNEPGSDKEGWGAFAGWKSLPGWQRELVLRARFDEKASALLAPFVLPGDEKDDDTEDYLGCADPYGTIFALVLFVRGDNAVFFLDHDLAGKFADGSLPRPLYPHFWMIMHHADSFCRFQLGGFELLRRHHDRRDFPDELFESFKRRAEDHARRHCAGIPPGVLR